MNTLKKHILYIVFICISANIYGQINLDSGLIGYWPFNANMNDESQFNNHANNNGALLAPDREGNVDKAYEFNGQTNFAEIPYSYNEITLPFSISAWVKKDNIIDHEHIFSSSSGLSSYNGVYLSINPQGRVQISYTDGGTVGPGSRRTKLSGSAIPSNEWVHIAVVVNGPFDMIIQVNSEVQSGQYSGFGSSLSNGTEPAMIGRAAHNPDYFSGSIDEVRLYNRALSNAELFELCDSEFLPIEITNFNAKIQNSKVALTWETLSEINNKGFEIQKLFENDLEWESIDFVNGKENSNQVELYSFIDEDVKYGENYYRLKQLDLNGDYSYSPIKMVFKIELNKLSVWPTIAKNIIQLKWREDLNNDYLIQIIDVMGNVVFKEIGSPTEIEIHDLREGQYVLIVLSGSKIHRCRFVKIY